MSTAPRIIVTHPADGVQYSRLDGVLHVETMDNLEINILLDRLVFKHNPWCTGRRRFYGYRRWLTLPACMLCGFNEQSAVDQFLGDDIGHPRVAPDYTKDMQSIWPVVEAMRSQDKATEICFLLNVSAPLRGYTRWIFEISPRIVAIAALKACGVIDADGFVREGR